MSHRRFIGLWLTSLIVFGSLATIVPTSSAGTVSPVEVKVILAGNEVNVTTPVEDRTVHVGSAFDLYAFTNITLQPCTTPTVEVTADLSRFGLSSGQALSNLGGNARVVGYHRVNVAPGTVNGADTTISATVKLVCAGGIGDSQQTGTSHPLLLDNVQPAATVSVTGSGTGGIGSTFSVQVADVSADAETFTLDVSQLRSTGSVFDADISTLSSALVNLQNAALEAQGHADAELTFILRDAHGNTWTANNVTYPAGGFDTDAPDLPTVTATPTAGPTLDLLVGQTDGDTDIEATLTDHHGASTTVSCPADGCSLVKESPLHWRLTGAPLSGIDFRTNRTYTAAVRSVDGHGNVGPAATVTFTTLQEPLGTLRFNTVPGTGNGGIGTQFTLTFEPGTRDVHTVTLVAPDLGIPSATFGNDTTFTGTVQEGAENPTFSVTLTSCGTDAACTTGARTATATVINPSGTTDFSFLDAKRPDALTAAPSVLVLDGGDVRVSFSAIADAERYLISYANATTTSTFVGLAADDEDADGTVVAFTLPRTLFDVASELQYSFAVTPRDERNNTAAASPAATAIVSATPLSLTITPGQTATGKGLPGTAGVPALSGAWSSPNAGGEIRIGVQRTSDGLWWNGADATGDSAFQASQVDFPVTSVAPGAGTWTATTFAACTPTCDPDPSANWDTLADGAYTLVVTIRDDNGRVRDASHAFTLDRTAPTPLVGDGRNTYVGPVANMHQGYSNITYRVDYKDELAGLGEIRFDITRQEGSVTKHARDVNGNTHPTIVCPSSSCSVLNTNKLADGTEFWNVSFRLSTLPLGSYGANVTVVDAAGNAHARAPLTTPAISLAPRLRMTTDDTYPFGDASGIAVQAYAAFTNTTTHVPVVKSCSATYGYACPVTEVVFQGRARSGDGTPVALNLSMPGPRNDQTPVLLTDAGGQAYFWDFSPTARIDPNGLDISDMDIRALAHVRLGNGQEYTAATEWTRVRTGLVPGGLSIVRPADDSTVYMKGEPGSVALNVTFDQSGLSMPPELSYTLFAVNSVDANVHGRYVAFDGSTLAIAPAGQVLTVQRNLTNHNGFDGPIYHWNWTNNATLPAGEYVLNLTVSNLGTMGARTLSRFFAVESASPTITFSPTQPEIFQGSFVRRVFTITTDVDHGYANITSSSLVPTLIAPNAGGGSRRVAVGDEGFAATVKNIDPSADGRSSTVNLTVTLPENATDGVLYYLELNVTTLSHDTGGKAAANASAAKTITPDFTNPVPSVLRETTNSTGIQKSSPLSILGVAQDPASGVAAVEVRIFDRTTNRTFVWDATANGTWVNGEVSSWMTSEIRPAGDGDYVRNVQLQTTGSCTAQLACWAVSNEGRQRLKADGTASANTFNGGAFSPIGLHRDHQYRVDVRARDHAGLVSAVVSRDVRFDPMAPNITASLQGGGAASDFVVDWHGAGTLSVGAEDNHCIKRVTLVGTRPDGEPATPVNFPRPTGAECTSATSDQARTWTLDLAQAHVATHLVGKYNYTFEVEDTAGNLVRWPGNITLTVEDTQRALVRYLYLEPPIVGADTFSTIVAEVEEFGEMDRVRVFFSRLHGTTSTLLAEGLARPMADDAASKRVNGNGTYWYEARTDLDLNVTDLPVGDYMWEVRAYDSRADLADGTCVKNGCHQMAIILRVTADAEPVIQLESPGASTQWINGTPSFRWRIFNYDAGAAGLVLLAGNSTDNMTAVNATNVTPITSATTGNVTGAVVSYRPTIAEDGSFSVSLRATSTSGFFNQSDVLTYAVDRTVPSVEHAVNGTVTIDNETYALRTTRVSLNASDATSGIASLRYRINGGAETPYVSPVLVGASNGEWTLSWTATDLAGNAATGSVTLRTDTAGPEIRVVNRDDDMVLVVEDKGATAVGVNESTVVVHYAYGDGDFQEAQAVRDTSNSYSVSLGGDALAVGLRFYVVAEDLLGNEGSLGSPTDPEVIEKEGEDLPPPPPPPQNTPPIVKILRPTAGAQLRDEVIVQWESTDPDGDALDVRLDLVSPAGPGEQIRTGAPASGTMMVNLSGKAPGGYTIIVLASDGEETTSANVTFTLLAGQKVQITNPLPRTASQGATLQFGVRVASGDRIVENATYVVRLDGQELARGPMLKQGDLYLGQYIPEAPGDYEVSVLVAYEEGAPETISMGAFTVAGQAVGPEDAGDGGMPAPFIALLVLAVLTIGLSAGGAFWRWRK